MKITERVDFNFDLTDEQKEMLSEFGKQIPLMIKTFPEADKFKNALEFVARLERKEPLKKEQIEGMLDTIGGFYCSLVKGIEIGIITPAAEKLGIDLMDIAKELTAQASAQNIQLVREEGGQNE